MKRYISFGIFVGGNRKEQNDRNVFLKFIFDYFDSFYKILDIEEQVWGVI